MKTLSKLFLTAIFLVANQTHASFNVNNPPQEIPTDLQDKLAWGLWNLDKSVTMEALSEGANPQYLNFFYETETQISAYTRNAYDFLYDLSTIERTFKPCPHHLSKSDIEQLSAPKAVNGIAYLIQQGRKLFEIFELLIIAGLSVDEKIDISLFGNPNYQSMRQIIDEHSHEMPYHSDVEYGEHDIENDGSSIGYQVQYMLWKNLQLLVNKHQPLVKIHRPIGSCNSSNFRIA